MIGRLTGTIIAKYAGEFMMDVSGVGYEVAASSNTLNKLVDAGQTMTVHTHLVVREDAHTLYGFYDQQERTLFRVLIKVNGVGAKLALRILSAIDPDQFVRCIYEQDVNQLVKLPGIGKKTAERLLIEIRDRLTSLNVAKTDKSTKISSDKTTHETGMTSASQDAMSALISLGFPPPQASFFVAKVPGEIQDPAAIVRQALTFIREHKNAK